MLRSLFLRILIRINRKFLIGKTSPAPTMQHEIKSSHLLEVGTGTYGVEHLVLHSWDNSTKIYIGKYCSIADEVHIFLGGNHDVSKISTFPFGEGTNLIGPRKNHVLSKGHIKIGNDVWIGSHASIMSGTNIGNGAVIAAFAHVVRDVADYEVVGGKPAKHIKFRFSKEIIDALIGLQWWDWPDKKVIQMRDLLCSEPKLEQIHKLPRNISS